MHLRRRYLRARPVNSGGCPGRRCEPGRLSQAIVDDTGSPPGMAKIRILTESDVPAVAALFSRVYPEQRWRSQIACESYFREMLFDNPWRDLELPSWVTEADGHISGCYALLPRRMLLHGRPVRVATACQFLVDPDRGDTLTALELMRAVTSGAQDLTLADGSTEQARRLWTSLGGTAPLLYGLHWTRPLRPARHALSLLKERDAIPFPLTFAVRPLGTLADAFAARLPPNRFYREAAGLQEDTLDADTMLSHLPEVLRGYALQPAYDAQSLSWLLEQTARKTRHGRLRARVVRDGKQRLLGWYLYFVQAGGVSEVVQVAAMNGSFDLVLRGLLADAWRLGAAAVRGRLDPRFAREFSDRHCWLRTEGTWTLVHSPHPEILAAIHQGDAFLSRLEGEWWLRFLGG
jgi:Acetyltransferase (GNAT) domain